MALLFMDSFNHTEDAYNTQKWSFNDGWFQSGIGRYGDYGLLFSNDSKHAHKNLSANCSTIILGTAIKTPGHNTNNLLVFHDTGSAQITIEAWTDGSIKVYRGTSTLLGSAPAGSYPINAWAYFEIKILFSNTVGTVEVKINESQVLSLTGVDTVATANEYANELEIKGNGFTTYTYYDDLYILDDSGGVNDDFLGDVKITALYPTSDGTNTDFTPSSGADHYAMVDDPQLSALTDYNESSTVGHKDTYGMTTFTGTGTIYGIQTNTAVINPDSGAMVVRPLMISGATPTETEGDSLSLSVSLQTAMQVYDIEPIDAVAWTATKVNAAEFGVKVQS